MSKSSLLKLDELKTKFRTERGLVTAVDGLTMNIKEGEILGVVGESGCGKSVTSQSILRLFDEKRLVQYGGKVLFKGNNLFDLPIKNMQSIRGNNISMIFQDPLSSLNPVLKIGSQIIEAIMIHQKISKSEAKKRAVEILKLTGIPDPQKRINEYPHELSGGMRQRVMIAIALSCEPELLIADEPTTALDVTIQAQILNLIVDLNKRLGMGVMFITHDLGVVAEICTRVVIMYLGKIVEEADVEAIFDNSVHPYTKGLMKSIPKIDDNRKQELHTIKGVVPSLEDVPRGCRFATRCPLANEICFEEEPDLQQIDKGHKVRCWYAEEINNGVINI